MKDPSMYAEQEAKYSRYNMILVWKTEVESHSKPMGESQQKNKGGEGHDWGQWQAYSGDIQEVE